MLTKGDNKYTKRTRYVAELSNNWWKAWFSRCFPSLFTFRGLVKKVRNLEVRDIVLVENKFKLGKASYQMPRVIQTYLSDDRLVRKITLEPSP